MSITVTTAPAIEPLSLSEVKDHLNLTDSFTDDNALLLTYIAVSREHVENYIKRALLTQTIVARFDRFSACIELERPALKSVTSIQYIDDEGNTQTLSTDNYDVDIYSTPGKITLAYGYTWPSTRIGVPNTVTITYVTGETSADDVPAPIRHACLLLTAHFYEHKEIVATMGSIMDIPISFDSLLLPYRVA